MIQFCRVRRWSRVKQAGGFRFCAKLLYKQSVLKLTVGMKRRLFLREILKNKPLMEIDWLHITLNPL